MFGDGTWNSHPQKELKWRFNSQNSADVCICLLCKQTTLPQVLIALVISKLGPQNCLNIWAHCGVITIIFQFSLVIPTFHLGQRNGISVFSGKTMNNMRRKIFRVLGEGQARSETDWNLEVEWSRTGAENKKRKAGFKNDTLKSADVGASGLTLCKYVLRTAMNVDLESEASPGPVPYNFKLYGYCNLINIGFLLQNVPYHQFIEKSCLEISNGRKVL